jgi:hypothetical protein
LRPEEVTAISEGLVAKNPDAKGASVAEHVQNGSDPGYKSPYISTTANLEVAFKFANVFQEVVVIDWIAVQVLRKDKVVFDLTNSGNRYITKSSSFATRSEEMLILSRVPAQCLSMLGRTFETLFERWSRFGDDIPPLDDMVMLPYTVVGGPNDGLLRVSLSSERHIIVKRPRPNIYDDRLCGWEELKQQSRREFVGLCIYEICGIKVPRCKLVEAKVAWNFPDGIKKTCDASVLILEDVSFCETEASDALKVEVETSHNFALGFAVDCLLGNWHVFGGSDVKNIAIGGFRANIFRVMGFTTSEDEIKYAPIPFEREVHELVELRKLPPFSSLTTSTIGQQVELLLSKKDQIFELLELLQNHERDLIKERLNYLYSWLNWNRLSGQHYPPARDGHVTFNAKRSNEMFVFGGNTKKGACADVWVLDTEKAKWNEIRCEQPPAPRFSMAAACVGHNAFIIGGRNDENRLFGDILVFDMETKEWVTRAWKMQGVLPPALTRHACAVVGNRIVLFGGEREHEVKEHPVGSKGKRKHKKLRRSNQLFVGIVSIASMQIVWELQDSSEHCPLPVHRHAMCSNNKCVYVIGGFSDDHSHPFSQLFAFNVETRVWSLHMTNAASVIGSVVRAGNTACIWDEELIIVGGGGTSRSYGGIESAFGTQVQSHVSSMLFALNLKAYTWRNLTHEVAGPSPPPMSGHTCAVLGSPQRMWFFGGRPDEKEFFNHCFSLRVGPPEEMKLLRIQSNLAELEQSIRELHSKKSSNLLIEKCNSMMTLLKDVRKKHSNVSDDEDEETNTK